MARQQLVLALFEDEAADVAAEAVQNWAYRTERARLSSLHTPPDYTPRVIDLLLVVPLGLGCGDARLLGAVRL